MIALRIAGASLTALLLLASDPPRPAKPAPPPAAAEAPRDPLSPLARSLLRQRMDHHAASMNRLMASVLMLRYPEAQVAADELLDQPFWARASTPGDLNGELPEAFFAYQDQLRTTIREVSAASAQRQPAALGAAFGRLSQSCVACHAAYLPPTR